MRFKKAITGMMVLSIGMLVVGCNIKSEKITDDTNKKEDENTISMTRDFKDEFTISPIPDDIYNKMIGKSIPNEGVINRDNLSYLKITYYGFDNKEHIGEMIVAKEVASEVLDIFKELYSKEYPIEKIKLIDEYEANDELSMQDNNTSAFCYRVVDGSEKLSNHAKGLAIDINPLLNPMVKDGVVTPKDGEIYGNRDNIEKGMITKGDACYEAFTKRGWTWGGEWKSLKDYQHFEKK